MLRGDIFFANIPTTTKSTHIQLGFRPWLVVQNNMGNKHSPTTIVVPITGNINKKIDLPTHCLINAESMKTSMVLCEQIRVIDVLPEYQVKTRLSDSDMEKVDNCLKIALALEV